MDMLCVKNFYLKLKYDKRVFIINGKVCGAISRIPKKGLFYNMSKGAKPVSINLTRNENIEYYWKRFKKKIFFLLVSTLLIKSLMVISIFSPTGLKTYYDLSKINLAKTFGKNLKREKFN